MAGSGVNPEWGINKVMMFSCINGPILDLYWQPPRSNNKSLITFGPKQFNKEINLMVIALQYFIELYREKLGFKDNRVKFFEDKYNEWLE